MAPSTGANHPGFWGDVTSTIDWCEVNYEVSYFVAEFWNSVSNLAFILPPLVVAYHLRRDLDPVFILGLVYMSVTGMGSFAFHATLKYAGQLWDELSMVWSGLFILYLIIKILVDSSDDNRQSRSRKTTSYATFLIFYGLLTNFIYLGTNQWLIFQVAYAIIHFSVVIVAYRLHQFPTDNRLYWATIIMSTIGFTLWNIDNKYCPILDDFRRKLGQSLPTQCLVPFTQLHALWHVLAGYGAFTLVLYCIQARLASKGSYFVVHGHVLSGLTLRRLRRQVPTTDYNDNYPSRQEVEEGPGSFVEGIMTSGVTITHNDHHHHHHHHHEDKRDSSSSSSSPGGPYSKMVKSRASDNNRKRD